MTKKCYDTPELRTAGPADEVVLGNLVGGADVMDQFLIPNAEFQTDRDNSRAHRSQASLIG